MRTSSQGRGQLLKFVRETRHCKYMATGPSTPYQRARNALTLTKQFKFGIGALQVQQFSVGFARIPSSSCSDPARAKLHANSLQLIATGSPGIRLTPGSHISHPRWAEVPVAITGTNLHIPLLQPPQPFAPPSLGWDPWYQRMLNTTKTQQLAPQLHSTTILYQHALARTHF